MGNLPDSTPLDLGSSSAIPPTQNAFQLSGGHLTRSELTPELNVVGGGAAEGRHQGGIQEENEAQEAQLE